MRAAIYCRVSTGIQEDGYSLGFQEQQCRDYAAGRGYEAAAVYSDVHTGAEWRERKALTELRQELRAGGVDVVVCYALDRLSRDQTHIAVLVDEIEYGGARLELVTEEFEDSAVGKFIRSAKAFAAEVEREKITTRSIDGRRARVLSGKLLAGPRPLYGYRWRDAEKTALDVDPDTGPVAARIYDAARAGKPLRQIARELTADRIPTPTGRERWSPETIRRILTHPGYSGRAYGWAWRPVGTRADRVFDSEGAIELPEGTIPALVSSEVWEYIQERLTLNKLRASRNNRQPYEALMRGGLAVCGHCGRTLHVHKVSHGLIYQCMSRYKAGTDCAPHNIVLRKVDGAAWAKLKEVLLRPEVVMDEFERMVRDDDSAHDRQAIERTIADLKRRQQNLIRELGAISDPDIAAGVRVELEALGQRRRQLEADLAGLERQREDADRLREGLGKIGEWSQSLAANLDELSYEHKRWLLERFGFKATVYNSKRKPRVVITAGIPLDLPTRSPDETPMQQPESLTVTRSYCSSGHNVVMLRWAGDDAAD